jgi:hypothetical protein
MKSDAAVSHIARCLIAAAYRSKVEVEGSPMLRLTHMFRADWIKVGGVMSG